MKKAALLALLLGASVGAAAPAPLPKADRNAQKEKARTLSSQSVPAYDLEPPPPERPIAVMLLPPRPIPAGLENADPPLND